MVKIAILALGGPSSLEKFSQQQQAGLATALADQNRILLYQAAKASIRLQERVAPNIFKINLWTPSAGELGAIAAGFLAAVHLRLVEKPDHAVVLNPWNAVFVGPRSAKSGTAVAVDNLVRPQHKATNLGNLRIRLLGAILARRAKAHPGRFMLTAHSEFAAAAFEKHFGPRPIKVAAGISPNQIEGTKPASLLGDPLLRLGFDVLVGSIDQPKNDAMAIRAHARGTRDVSLVYLPALDIKQIDSDELDEAIAKHGQIRAALNAGEGSLHAWLLASARLVIAADHDLLGTSLGSNALLAPAELLLVDSPPNRELLSEAAWLWPGEVSLSNLLTDQPWQSNSRAKLRIKGLRPLTHWHRVAKELIEIFEG